MKVFELFGQVSVNRDEVNEELDSIDDKAQETGDSVDSSFGQAAAGAAKFAAKLTAVAAAAGGALLALTNKTADYGDELDKTSMKMGVSTEALQEMRFASEQMGVDASTLERSMYNLNREIGRGEDASASTQQALEQLNVEAENADEAFTQTVTALSEMEDQQDRTALASEIFGSRMARDLLPIIEQGGEEFEQLRDRAQELGIVMDEDAIEQSVEFHDTMHEVREVLAAVIRDIAMRFMPSFQNFLEWMLENIPKVQHVFWFLGETVRIVSEAIGETINRILDSISPITEVVEGFWDELKTIWKEEDLTLGEKVIKTAELGFETLKVTSVEIWDWLADKVPYIELAFDRIKTTTVDAWDWAIDNIPLLEAGIDKIKAIGEPIMDITIDALQARIELFGDTYEAIRKGFTDGDWSDALEIAPDVWREGVNIAVTLALVAGAWAKLKGAISAGLLGVKALTPAVGLPGVMAMGTIAMELLEAMDEGDYGRFAGNIISALAAGAAAFALVGSPEAGYITFTLWITLGIGDAFYDRTEEVKEELTGISEAIDEEGLVARIIDPDRFEGLKEDIDSTQERWKRFYDWLIGNSLIPDMVNQIGYYWNLMGSIINDNTDNMLTSSIDKFGWFYNVLIGNSIWTDMTDEMQEAWSKMWDRIEDETGTSMEDITDGIDDWDIDPYNVEDDEPKEEVDNTLENIENRFSRMFENIFQTTVEGFGNITRALFDGTQSWAERFESIGDTLRDITGSIWSEVESAMISGLVSLASEQVTQLAPVIAGYLAQAYSGLFAFYSTFAGPLAPVLAGGTLAAGMGTLAALGYSMTAPSTQEGPDDGPETRETGTRAGTQYAQFTGPDRDLLVDLLTPLARLDSLEGIGNRIYNILDERLPQMNGVTTTGAGEIVFESGAIQVQTTDETTITNDMLDEIEEGMADRIYRGRRGIGDG